MFDQYFVVLRGALDDEKVLIGVWVIFSSFLFSFVELKLEIVSRSREEEVHTHLLCLLIFSEISLAVDNGANESYSLLLLLLNVDLLVLIVAEDFFGLVCNFFTDLTPRVIGLILPSLDDDCLCFLIYFFIHVGLMTAVSPPDPLVVERDKAHTCVF